MNIIIMHSIKDQTERIQVISSPARLWRLKWLQALRINY